jgi:osmotically-inducible protein OsmY
MSLHCLRIPQQACHPFQTKIALSNRVEAQLYWNRATHGMAVDVSTHDGIVTLQVQSTDPQQAELASLITINTCGVKQVNSQLQTISKQ